MEKKSIDKRAAAIAAVQRNVQQTRLGKPQRPSGEEPPIIKVRRNLGFYDNIPWDDVQYFSQDVSVAWPIAGVGPHALYNYVVPANTVLDLTSFVFRATTLIDPNWFDHAYLHDGYFLGRAWFVLRIAGTSIFARDLNEPTFSVPTAGDVYNVLNQDIMVPELPFHLFANPGSEVTAQFFLTNVFYLNLPVTAVIAEARGLLLPKVLFDRLRKEFSS